MRRKIISKMIKNDNVLRRKRKRSSNKKRNNA